MFDDIYDIPLTDHIRVTNKKKPYSKMSKLGKAVHDARQMGMTYGQYMGYRENGTMTHKGELHMDGKVYIV